MGTRVYVGNLHPDLGSDEVREAFVAAGYPAAQVVLVRDPVTGRRRGFGFVDLEDDRQAAAAQEDLDGTRLHGRALSVRSTPNRPRTRFINER